MIDVLDSFGMICCIIGMIFGLMMCVVSPIIGIAIILIDGFCMMSFMKHKNNK